VTYGGTLKLMWTGTSLSSGTVDLFDGSGFSGGFSAVQLVNWPPAFRVTTNNLTVDGSIAIAANAAPVAASFEMNVPSGGSTTAEVAGKFATDTDGDSLTLMVTTAPANGTATVVGGNILYTSTNAATSDSFTYTVTDPFGAADTKAVTVAMYSPQGFNKLSGPTMIGGGPNYSISYLGIPNEKYALDETSDLTPPISWSPVVTNTASGTGSLEFIFTPVNPSGYFRTRHVP
jgi:hypothetical protein